jgi:aminoglycoside phosphotransferase family enzyme/predicted kinase
VSPEAGALSAQSIPGAASAQMLETHISVVFLVGSLAFKLKKPVDLGFLDWTSRPARQLACAREVELNHRLAPDVYLGVADVMTPDGAPLDHLVMMRRMPEARRLSTLATGGGNLSSEVRAVAKQLAAFHAGADTSGAIGEAGDPERLLHLWEDNFAALRRCGREVIDPAAMDEVELRAHRYIAGRHPLLQRRVDAGLIRDGHGDLQADDIFLLEDGPRLLDCLEFDDGLRHGDVLSDAAFLAMDLERLDRPDLAREFLEAYREFTAESHPATLEHHYIAYRAHVRAKVKCIRVAQGDAGAGAAAQALHRLSLEHLRTGSVRLVVVGGAPGTGKSTLAGLLGERRGWAVLRSDAIRREALAHVADPQERYSARARDQVYTETLSRAERLLVMGESVVLDATWAEGRWRAAAADVAGRTTSDLYQFCCDVRPEIAQQRAAARQASGVDMSEAGPREADLVRRHFAAWPEAITVRTEGTSAEAIRQVDLILDAD